VTIKYSNYCDLADTLQHSIPHSLLVAKMRTNCLCILTSPCPNPLTELTLLVDTALCCYYCVSFLSFLLYAQQEILIVHSNSLGIVNYYIHRIFTFLAPKVSRFHEKCAKFSTFGGWFL